MRLIPIYSAGRLVRSSAPNLFNGSWHRKLAVTVAVAAIVGAGACSSSSDESEVASLTRILSGSSGQPGAQITITVQPTGIGGFFAVDEDIGELELVSHSADSLRDGVFVQLEERSFDYTVRIPATAGPGAIFIISGQYWADPEIRKTVAPAESVLTAK